MGNNEKIDALACFLYVLNKVGLPLARALLIRIESCNVCKRVFTLLFEGLFQQFSIVITAFKYAHLVNGNLIELDQSFRLWHPLFNKHGI